MTKSIFEKITFKQVLLLGIFLIVMDLWRIFNFITNKEVYSMLWLSISVGALLIAIGIFAHYRIIEKAGFIVLGISFIMDWLGNVRLISIPLSSSFSILFVIGALYLYRLSYKNNERAIKRKPISLALLLILILIILLPPLFFWIIGILSNLTR